MIDDLAPIAIFLVFAYIIKLFLDHKIRRLALEKAVLSENLKYLFYDRFEGKVPTSLKWGFVLIGIGLAFIIGQIVPPHMTEEITIGAMFFFAGIGLIAYYFVANRIYKRAKQEEHASNEN